MNLGYRECYINLLFTAKLNKIIYDCGIIQVSKSFRNKYTFSFYTRFCIQIIIITQVVFIQ
jgi:hypothetical protein